MQEKNGITVDYAFIAQRSEVAIHGLLSVEGGGISRLVVGSRAKSCRLRSSRMYERRLRIRLSSTLVA